MPKHIITNFSQLAQTPLRKDALAILEAGLEAVATRPALASHVQRVSETLFVDGTSYDLSSYKNIYVIGIGKAAFDAASELEHILGNRITDGIVIDVKGGNLKHMSSRVGTHPYPSLQNMKATGEIVALLKHVQENDLLITIISGGGSSLLCWPSELTCTDMTSITRTLMSKGATIQEINIVRKHTSDIQGGRLVAIAKKATIIGLIFSDVPGDDLCVVASGPTCLDTSTVADASLILAKYDLMKTCQLPACNLTETPKDPALFEHVNNVMIAGAQQALHMMGVMARRNGYKVRTFSTQLVGEAREAGIAFAKALKKGEVLLAAGETTVTIHGAGMGGRNQEFVLGALSALPKDALVISCATDGIDHSPVAGAIADELTQQKADKHKLNASHFLNTNDSYSFFAPIKQHILTGITGMNVSDIMIGIRK